MLVKQKVFLIERHMTLFWKEERWGYNIYQKEQNKVKEEVLAPLYPYHAYMAVVFLRRYLHKIQ